MLNESLRLKSGTLWGSIGLRCAVRGHISECKDVNAADRPWLERKAVNLKVGSSSLQGSVL